MQIYKLFFNCKLLNKKAGNNPCSLTLKSNTYEKAPDKYKHYFNKTILLLIINLFRFLAKLRYRTYFQYKLSPHVYQALNQTAI